MDKIICGAFCFIGIAALGVASIVYINDCKTYKVMQTLYNTIEKMRDNSNKNDETESMEVDPLDVDVTID